MNPRLLFVGVVLWLGVVLVGSAITWLVIDQVGRHVVTAQEPGEDTPVAGTSVTTAVPAPTSSSAPRAHRPATQRPATAQPTSPPSGVSSPDAAATLPPQSAPRTPRTPGPRASTTRPPGAQPPQDQAVTRTWSGAGGRVTVSCTGADARLVSASPADGWRVAVGSRGPDEVEVELKQFAEEGAESQVKSRCTAGEPRFVVEQGD